MAALSGCMGVAMMRDAVDGGVARTSARLDPILGTEYAFVLVVRPGEESWACGGLIAEASARGRPPLVGVLTDGSSMPARHGRIGAEALAALHERETRAAAAALRLPAHRLLMLGVIDSMVPQAGPEFEAAVSSIASVMSMRDCNVLCGPADGVELDHVAALAIARAVGTRTGVGVLSYRLRPGPGEASSGYPEWTFEVAAHRDAKARAMLCHGALRGSATASATALQREVYVKERSPT